VISVFIAIHCDRIVSICE